MPSPSIELPIDPTDLNLASENGDPNTMPSSENQDSEIKRDMVKGFSGN